MHNSIVPLDDTGVFQADAIEFANALPPESVALLYMDPPFGKGKTYTGRESLTFDDIWEGGFDGYLSWLRELLQASHRVLKTTGSLFLHLDPLASHYAKVLLDEVFGRERFLNEIIWHHTGGGRSHNYFSRKHQTILWYAKTNRHTFEIDRVRTPYSTTSGYAKSGITSKAGKKYLPHPEGTPVDDVWSIPMINPMSRERVGYPTQKPILLLERIISAASQPGELVADFTCGSGTTLVAAKKLGRRWLGCDVSADAVKVALQRLESTSAAAD